MFEQIKFFTGLAVLAVWLIWFLWPAIGPLLAKLRIPTTAPTVSGGTVELVEHADPRAKAFECVTFLHDHFSQNKCDEGRKAIESALALLLRKAG